MRLATGPFPPTGFTLRLRPWRLLVKNRSPWLPVALSFSRLCGAILWLEMAAINVIRQKHAVHIISDGAFCDNSGIVCEIGPNAFALPHLPAALAIRGSTHFMPFLVHRLSRECRTFDDLLAKIVRTAYEVHLSFPMAFGSLAYGAIEPDFDLVIVGWSKAAAAPASYLVSSHDRLIAPGLTATAWQLLELPEILVAPPITEAGPTVHFYGRRRDSGSQEIPSPPPGQTEFLPVRAGESLPSSRTAGWRVPDSAEAFRVEIDAIPLLHAQRMSPRELDPRFGRGFIHVVGGFIQVTSVTDRAVNSEILHWWPDPVGRRIEPKL